MKQTTRYIGLISLFIAGSPVFAQAPAFSVWLEGLRLEAIDSGVSESTANAALANVTPVERIIELDRNQPEFKLDFWEYVGRVVSNARIEQGRVHLELHREMLEDVQSRYGIPPPVLVAAWGVESNYGRKQGS